MGMFIKGKEILDEIRKLFKCIPQYKIIHDNYSVAQIFEKPVQLPEDVEK